MQPHMHALLEVREVLGSTPQLTLGAFLLFSLLWLLERRAPEHIEICSDVLETPTAYALPDRIT
jgi:hypothetical protein